MQIISTNDEELREIETKYKMLKVLAHRFLMLNDWSEMIANLLRYRVMRYPQIIQSLMFLTGSNREDICLPRTNKLCWKWIREIKTNQIPKAMMEYSMYGETKGRKILPYQTVVYCEKLIDGLTQVDVENYHNGLGRLFKWLTTALAGRKLDITRRKIKTRRDKEDRQEKIAKEEDRKQRREDYLIDSRSQWQENNQELIDEYERWVDRQRRKAAGEHVSDDSDDDGGSAEGEGEARQPPTKPEFDEEGALKLFDEKEENAIIPIPDEVVDEIDDDWPMTQEEEQKYIDDILDSRASA